MKTTLTPEQSQRLIELGVDPGKASATRYIIAETEVYYGYSREVIVTDGYINDYVGQEPVFTLTDILSLLPKVIKVDGITYNLNIDYPPICQVAASYIDGDGDSLKGMMCTELIDALFELLVWCITNKHIEL